MGSQGGQGVVVEPGGLVSGVIGGRVAGVRGGRVAGFNPGGGVSSSPIWVSCESKH